MADHAKPERVDDDVWVSVHTGREDNVLSTVESSAKEVFDILGTGHCESIYRNALAFELQTRGYHNDKELPVIVWYKHTFVGLGRADIVLRTAGNYVVLELKQCIKITPAHEAQARAYARSLGSRACVVNFGPESVEVRSVVV